MDFLDETGTRYQLTEAVEAPAAAQKAPVWPWVLGGLAVAGGLVWMASSSPRKVNPVNPELKALIEEARDPTTSFHHLKSLQQHPEVEVRRALLDNPNLVPTQEDGTLNTSLLRALAREFPEEVAGHPLFVLHALVEPDYEMDVVVGEVVRRTADVGLIEQVFRTWGSDLGEVRYWVAMNPSTPVDLLRLLGNEATESEWSVRKAVTKNPSTPEDTLRALGNPKTESDGYVRHGVAQNPNTPEDTLRLLGNKKTESDGNVRQSVAQNPNTPEDTLRLLGNKKTESEWYVRQSVAQNPNTPEDTLRLLGNKKTESDGNVRAAAKKALAARGLS